MDVTSEYNIPRYTPTEELMDNLEINTVEFASKLDSFKVACKKIAGIQRLFCRRQNSRSLQEREKTLLSYFKNQTLNK